MIAQAHLVTPNTPAARGCRALGHHSRDLHRIHCRPALFAELRARILADTHVRRHADAERHSEARAGGNTARRAFVLGNPNASRPAPLALWTLCRRQDQHADLAGQPATMTGPILAAATSAAQQTGA